MPVRPSPLTWCVGDTRPQNVFHPVPHRCDANAEIVDLAVVISTFFVCEETEGLLLCADSLEAGSRLLLRDLLVAYAVEEKEGTPYALNDAVQTERLKPSQRFLLTVRAQHP